MVHASGLPADSESYSREPFRRRLGQANTNRLTLHVGATRGLAHHVGAISGVIDASRPCAAAKG
jgi:hypothetical protein